MRADVVAKIVDALAPIGLPVYEWRVVPFQLSPTSELPAIVVMDTEDEPEDDFQLDVQHRLSVEILVYVAAGNDTAKELRAKLADILAAMPAVERHYPLELLGVEMDLDHEDVIVGRGAVKLQARYVAKRWEL